jgi:hypothetical protein
MLTTTAMSLTAIGVSLIALIFWLRSVQTTLNIVIDKHNDLATMTCLIAASLEEEQHERE